ncbi:hypothetical protein B9Z55_012764 [Caenorhabditis nigoni]|uniref:F-box domain-containing protein n=1 Tax=Caenorhabditis nigoni TaxID=1611254 RepID=A0A2G5TYQ0_9PELO|nr:hypothetical protein B9Z55_012764 [Caenorhabditis nigoni]
MSSDLKIVTEMTKKWSIGPIYDTNWCDMPAEIKLECIGKMALNERCTAKAERSLVDSQKIKFNKGLIRKSCGDLVFLLSRDDKYTFAKRSKGINEAFELIKYIGKIGVFENLEISFGYLFTDTKKLITDLGLFTVKNIELTYCNIDNMIDVLRKVKNDVESIKMGGDTMTAEKLAEILEISHVQNVPYWHILNYEQTDCLYKVAQMWIDRNSKIGSTFQASVYQLGSFEKFSRHFNDRDRLVSMNEKRVRIRTNKPDHHILLERGFEEDGEIHLYGQYFRLMVISAELKESEYNDNCKEWIYKINPEIYKEYDSASPYSYDEYYEGFGWGSFVY